jgi:hypothetical protein
MGQNSTRALYALLYTQAQDKNYIVVVRWFILVLFGVLVKRP